MFNVVVSRNRAIRYVGMYTAEQRKKASAQCGEASFGAGRLAIYAVYITMCRLSDPRSTENGSLASNTGTKLKRGQAHSGCV
jgi:hypothetical protein